MAKGDVIERIVRLKKMRMKYQRLAADAKAEGNFSRSKKMMRAADRCTKAIQKEQRQL